MPMTPREMIKHLKKNGFREVSQNGSHVKMRNDDTKITVIVPYHSQCHLVNEFLYSSCTKYDDFLETIVLHYVNFVQDR